MNNQRSRVSQVSQILDYSQTVNELETPFPGIQPEGQKPTEFPIELFLRNSIKRVVLQAGIIDAYNL